MKLLKSLMKFDLCIYISTYTDMPYPMEIKKKSIPTRSSYFYSQHQDT